MAVFPSYDPVYSAPKNSEAKRQISKFGDGYESSTVFGLNRIRPEWSLQWIVEKEIAEQIEGFLQARADAAETFEWQPPDSDVLQKWKCEEWTVSRETYSVFKIDATFTRIFEIAPSELNTVDTTCVDEICESDYGDYTDYPIDVLGDWDVWVARLRGTVAGANNDWYMSNAYTFDDGYIYMAFVYQSELHVAKFQPSGNTIWIKKYPGAFYSYYYPGNNVISLAANESKNMLFLGWQVVDDSAPLFPTQFTRPMAVMSINSQNGDFRWGTYFVNRAACFTLTDDRQGQFFSLKYNSVFDRVYFIAALGGGTVITSSVPTDTGVIEYQTEQAGVPQQSVVDIGYLGTVKYTTGNSTDINIIPLYEGHHIYPPTTHYYFGTTDATAGGAFPYIAKFIGNGQILVYWRKQSSGFDEIMIVGANRQIVDHVRLPTPVAGFGISFPNGARGDMPSTQYGQVLLIPETKKLYLLGQSSRGPGYTEFSVSMSGNLITSINAITSRAEGNSNGNVAYNCGAMKYTANNNTVKRVTSAYGVNFNPFNTVECSLFSINRSMLATAGNIVFSAGSEASDVMKASPAFYVDNTEYQMLRTNLKGFLTTTQTSSGISIPITITADKNSCTGQSTGTRILAQRPFSTTPQDMTGALIFDLYTYKQPTAP